MRTACHAVTRGLIHRPPSIQHTISLQSKNRVQLSDLRTDEGEKTWEQMKLVPGSGRRSSPARGGVPGSRDGQRVPASSHREPPANFLLTRAKPSTIWYSLTEPDAFLPWSIVDRWILGGWWM
jgi:hypothetical protein